MLQIMTEGVVRYKRNPCTEDSMCFNATDLALAGSFKTLQMAALQRDQLARSDPDAIYKRGGGGQWGV